MGVRSRAVTLGENDNRGASVSQSTSSTSSRRAFPCLSYEEGPKAHTLALGHRVTVFGCIDGGGIGFVTGIASEDICHTMFNPNAIYASRSRVFNGKNWREGTDMERTTNLTQIDILGSAERFVGDVAVQILKYLALLAALALMPAVFTVWPLWVYWHDQSYGYFIFVATMIEWATPFSCAFYMFFLGHWTSIRYWQKMYGDTEDLREAHGDTVWTLECFFFLFAGLVGSFFFEILYLRASTYIGFDLYLPEYWRQNSRLHTRLDMRCCQSQGSPRSFCSVYGAGCGTGKYVL